MTHDELLSKIDANGTKYDGKTGVTTEVVTRPHRNDKALRAVVELHKPSEAWGDTHCGFCFDLAWEPSGLQMDEKDFIYPCPTIKAIEKELNA